MGCTSAGLKLQVSAVSAGICPAGLPKQIELLGVSSSSTTKINTILAANRRSVCLTALFSSSGLSINLLIKPHPPKSLSKQETIMTVGSVLVTG